jgi:hypothetical protein
MKKSNAWKAAWIWKRQESYNPYQQVVVARKNFRAGRFEKAEIRVTTDGWYRLLVNSEWVCDGPCRSWPEHFQFDEVDISTFLVDGENEIIIVARHWSAGNFHTVPRQAGLLAQINLVLLNGRTKHIATDRSWLVAEAPAWIAQTPKISIQMEPQEFYDARLEDDLVFEPAEILFDVDNGPWKDLRPRDVALLGRKPLALRSFLGANLVRKGETLDFCVPIARLVHPGLIEANMSLGMPGGICTIVHLDESAQLTLSTTDFRAAVDGVENGDGIYPLEAGDHFLAGYSYPLVGHNKDRSLRLVNPPAGMKLVNPLDSDYENPWVWIDLDGFDLVMNDMAWPLIQSLQTPREELSSNYMTKVSELLQAKAWADINGLDGVSVWNEPSQEMFVVDPHQAFLERQVSGTGAWLVTHPTALMHDNSETTIVHPSSEGDIELIYDLGEQSVGYYDLDLVAEAGVEIDIFGLEYITRDGTVQHTWGNRNGMRYITHEGSNRFISLKRRSQRYLFITLRKQTRPVRIRKIQVIESTYPINQQGWFSCSDARLDNIYEISARTLKLCMEDTFTDCPLFEQTHWVGDARNEAVFGFSIYGAEDLARRCIHLTAQSLERYPIVGCQVPSSWDCLIPVWSFLWGISVWDFYFYSGDRHFLREIWPAVLKNLAGAEEMLDQNGLFSGPYWNMFDWSAVDHWHHTVLHNTMFMIGAIQAARKCGAVLGETKETERLGKLETQLIDSVNRLWDAKRKVYPDSIHEDGKISESASMHTSALALLYDIATPSISECALDNILNPRNDLVKIGSPFASMYFFEALDKAGKPAAILASIYENYLPMLAEGATTVWELFPTCQDNKPVGFPTRSHTHAWSSAPLHFIPRIILGIIQTEPGGLAYNISPWPGNLEWARGAVASPRGAVEVEWHVENGEMHIYAMAPKGVSLSYVSNPELAHLRVDFHCGEIQ